jgi:hypothetical protein
MQIPEDAIDLARLLDSDSQLLSNGEVRLLASQNRGVFWIEEAAILNTILKSAAIVQMSSGEKMPIRNVHLCADRDSQKPHVHFDF